MFALKPINKNTRIIDYAGELIRNGRTRGRAKSRYLAQGCIWVFRVNRAWSRDAAVGGNIARFINHSCTPNCWFEIVDKTIWIRAPRRIRERRRAHLRLLHDGEQTIPCRCRPGCTDHAVTAVLTKYSVPVEAVAVAGQGLRPSSVTLTAFIIALVNGQTVMDAVALKASPCGLSPGLCGDRRGSSLRHEIYVRFVMTTCVALGVATC